MGDRLENYGYWAAVGVGRYSGRLVALEAAIPIAGDWVVPENPHINIAKPISVGGEI